MNLFHKEKYGSGMDQRVFNISIAQGKFIIVSTFELTSKNEQHSLIRL